MTRWHPSRHLDRLHARPTRSLASPTDAANPNPAGAGAFAYNLRLPGQVFDGQAGLHYKYFRGYDPPVGRSLSLRTRGPDPARSLAGTEPRRAPPHPRPLFRGRIAPTADLSTGWDCLPIHHLDSLKTFKPHESTTTSGFQIERDPEHPLRTHPVSYRPELPHQHGRHAQ